ncbi:hypothetical protein SERLA73DRAFT_149882 [Serpula lacrymans var. lacrymans S7.3]|uniref:Uncharacterized protein n=1 Tax=Serpula lacrymans var. lacrymans (strain S7.3) TaxID=936435 RepID=F8PL13_SERL3|nr:hypothetical protein SERLA73DRAFT_149882 [Serpula lacrymans var. lacrymans S7.3]
MADYEEHKQAMLGKKWPARTAATTELLIAEAMQQKFKAERKHILQQQFLCPVNLMCTSKSFALDPLHQIEQGEWGKHLWIWLSGALPKSLLAQINHCFQNCPPFPRIHHFSNGVTDLHFISGSEHGIILCIRPWTQIILKAVQVTGRQVGLKLDIRSSSGVDDNHNLALQAQLKSKGAMRGSNLSETEDGDERIAKKASVLRLIPVNINPDSEEEHNEEGERSPIQENLASLEQADLTFFAEVVAPFGEGIQTIRSNQVHVLADLVPTYIFKKLTHQFGDKACRPYIPAVEALLKDKRLAGHMQHLTLRGEERECHNSYAGICGNCCELEFAEEGLNHNFCAFYKNHIEIMQKIAKGHHNLMDYYNRSIFPHAHIHVGDKYKGYDKEEREYLEALKLEEMESNDEESQVQDKDRPNLNHFRRPLWVHLSFVHRLRYSYTYHTLPGTHLFQIGTTPLPPSFDQVVQHNQSIGKAMELSDLD